MKKKNSRTFTSCNPCVDCFHTLRYHRRPNSSDPFPMYSLAKKLLFRLDPETSHDLSLDWLGAAERLRLLKLFSPKVISDEATVMGLTFPNRVGLAAGLDKN